MKNMDYVLKQVEKLTNPATTKTAMSYLTNPYARVGLEAGTGAIGGIGAAMFDDEDDTVASTIGKGIKAAGIGYATSEGAMLLAGQYAKSQHFADIAAKQVVKRVPELSDTKGAAKTIHGAANTLLPSFKGKLGAGAAGMAAGLVFAGMNGQEDGVIGTASTMVAGGGLGLIGAELFEAKHEKAEKPPVKGFPINEDIQKIIKSKTGIDLKDYVEEKEAHKETARVEAEAQATNVAQQGEKHKQITVGDTAKEVPKVKQDNSFNAQNSEKRVKGWARKTKLAGAVGLGAFALASVMDTADGFSADKRVSRMKAEQEERLTKKQNQEESSQKQYSYGHMDMGDMVFEMFNNRIGHHKMGNAKFQ